MSGTESRVTEGLPTQAAEWYRPEAHRAALRTIRQMPMGAEASSALTVVPFLSEPGESCHRYDRPVEDAMVLDAQDVLWHIEDVLLRLAGFCPVRVEGSADQHALRIVGFRRHTSGPPDSLHWAVRDVDRYRWHAGTASGTKAGSFVQLIEYQGDDLLLRLAQMRQIRTWADGAMTWPVLVLVERLRRCAASTERRSAVGSHS